jgi:hypothetical protein
MAVGAIRRGHLAHPDNRLPGEPEAKAEATGVKDGRRETRSRDQRSWSQVGPAAPWIQPCSGQLGAFTCHRQIQTSAVVLSLVVGCDDEDGAAGVLEPTG